MEAVARPVRGMLEEVIARVREVAAKEVMPRYLKVAHQRKSDGSLFTEADLAAQEALSRVLPKIYSGPIVAEEMTPEQQARQRHTRLRAVGDVGLREVSEGHQKDG